MLNSPAASTSTSKSTSDKSLHQSSQSPQSSPRPPSLVSTLGLSLAAVGVVYGDIGTSPLYAIKEIFFGHRQVLERSPESILGVISLVFWVLIVMVTIKYVVLILRADNDGEGGVFALYSLLAPLKAKAKTWLMPLLIVAAGLLFGDGILTPAISVLSAVEGLSVVTTTFQPYVVPITIGILTALFLVQYQGTNAIGSVFGPTVLAWFLAIGGIGTYYVWQNPVILQALNPIYALVFLTSHSLMTLLIVLGAVVLVITGGEAMYADMGHFGRLPIRLSWLTVVLPALCLNYFGQGAYLLSGKPVVADNLFFSMVPPWALIPMIILATAATVIASQALITGAFSLATQAVSLGLLPYLPKKYTHAHHEGQIYVKSVNWLLYVGCSSLVLIFRTSSNLASAYGLAVSGVMLITTLAMVQLAISHWRWSAWLSWGVFTPLGVISLIFLVANSLKLVEGGYISLIVAAGVLIVMTTWKWGRKRIAKVYAGYDQRTVKTLIREKENGILTLPRSVVMMTPNPVVSEHDQLPFLEKIFRDRFGAVPQHLIFLTIIPVRQPHAPQRYELKSLFKDKELGSVSSLLLYVGFFEEVSIERVLTSLSRERHIPIPENKDKWFIHVVQERLYPAPGQSFYAYWRYRLFKLLQRNSDSADHYFGIGKHVSLSIEAVPVEIG